MVDTDQGLSRQFIYGIPAEFIYPAHQVRNVHYYNDIGMCIGCNETVFKIVSGKAFSGEVCFGPGKVVLAIEFQGTVAA